MTRHCKGGGRCSADTSLQGGSPPIIVDCARLVENWSEAERVADALESAKWSKGATSPFVSWGCCMDRGKVSFFAMQRGNLREEGCNSIQKHHFAGQASADENRNWTMGVGDDVPLGQRRKKKK